MGDPAGCPPSITAAAWTALRDTETPPFFVIAEPDLYTAFCPVAVISDPAEAADAFSGGLPVLPLKTPLGAPVRAGSPEPAHAGAVIDSIRTATAFCLSGEAAGLITNPISKIQLYQAGFDHPGHTEFLATLCAGGVAPPTPVMMLVGGGLKVALATIHVPLKAVPDLISTPGLIQIARIVGDALKRDFALSRPRLAFAGLNPHAGERGSLGREEVELINPAAEALRQSGYHISDARPADTVFHDALSGQFDAVIAMTHDQGLIPVKTLDLWGGVNTTLGLPIIRTSPDHGTAYEAAAGGHCRADSLIAAIRLAGQLAVNRALAHV